MTDRRMFSRKIIDSDAFLDLPLTAQSLYFHLSMRADDDGIVANPKRIAAMIGAKKSDLKVLTDKRFLLAFDSGVVAVKHWLIHNSIKADRYVPTTYTEEKATLTLDGKKAYVERGKKKGENGDEPTPHMETIRKQNGDDSGDNSETFRRQAGSTSGNILETIRRQNGDDSGDNSETFRRHFGNAAEPQDRIVKVSTKKRESIEREKGACAPAHTVSSRFEAPSLEEVRKYCEETGSGVSPDRFFNYYASVGWKRGNAFIRDWKAALKNWEQKDEAERKVCGNERKYSSEQLSQIYADIRDFDNIEV